MQQVVDLQKDEHFRSLGVQLLSISPDPVSAWADEGSKLGIATPMLSDKDNRVAEMYGVTKWLMATGEPGHTFVLVDETGDIAWIHDYGAPEHGGLMYVPPSDVNGLIEERLTSGMP